MVKILELSDIDEKKMNDLIDHRGHGIVYPEFMERVRYTLENDNDFQIHQCDCGEVIIIHEKMVKKFPSNNVQCKICSRSQIPGIISFGLFERLAAVGDLLDEMYKDESDIIYLQDDIVDEIKQLSNGIIACNDYDEILYSYWFTSDAFSHIASDSIESNKYMKDIESFISEGLKSDFTIIENFYKYLKVGDSPRRGNIDNIYYLINNIRPESNPLLKQFREEKKIIISKIEANMKKYINHIEQGFYLEFILNIHNTINGKKWSLTPFNKLITNKKGKKIDIKDLSLRLKYLSNNIKINNIDKLINESYNSQLRNAIAHNEYNIIPERKEIELTRYKKILSFNDFENYLENISDLQDSIDKCRINLHLHSIRKDMRDKGIYSIKLSSNEKDMIEIDIYQYWCFVYHNDDEKRYMPLPKFKINIPLQSLDISFEEKGYTFKIPIDIQIMNIITNLMESKSIKINLYTILPQFIDTRHENIIEINGFLFSKDGPNIENIKLDDESLIDILLKINNIIPNNSPLNEKNLVTLPLKYKRDELKKITKKMYKEHPYLSLEKADMTEIKKMFPGKDEEEIRKIIALPFSTKSTLSKYYPEKIVKHSYFLIIEIDDEDVALFDIENLTLVYVERDNCPSELNSGNLIWAKIISFPDVKYTCIWHFLEIKRYEGDKTYLEKWRYDNGI